MNVIESLEQRQLLSVVADQAHTATLRDADGSTITIRIAGPGTATADSVRGGFVLGVNGTNAATTLSLDVFGGNKYAVARSIRVRGSIGAIQARAVELAGALSAKSINSLDVRGLSNANLVSGWFGAINASRIANSTIAADRIGTMNIAGDMTNSRIHVSPVHDDQIAINSTTIRGTISNSTIFALGDIGSMSAGAMLKSNVTAGVIFSEDSTADRLIQPLPDEHDGQELYDFSGKYNIGRVTVTGSRPIAFSESIIGAHQLLDVNLANVDGSYNAAAEFGVAAFAIGKVKRSFDAANAAKDDQSFTLTRFTVRQIKEPLHFDPATGTYGGAIINLGGSPFGSSGATIITNTILPGGVTLTSDGVLLGTIENHRARTVYLAADGRYELRNRNNKAIMRSSKLGVLIDSLFADATTPIKVERPSTFGEAIFRVTSVGTALHLNQGLLGTRTSTNALAPSPTWWSGGLYVPGAELIATPSYQLPTFNELSIDLKSRGNKLLVYGENLLLVKDAMLPMGKLIGVMNTGALELTQAFAYTGSGLSNSSLSNLVIAQSADRIGSRRLPARWVPDGNSVTIYGLPNGGTAVINDLGRVALNASGATASISTAKVLKNSLIAADIGL